MNTRAPEHRRTFTEEPGMTTPLRSAVRTSPPTWKRFVPATTRNGVTD